MDPKLKLFVGCCMLVLSIVGGGFLINDHSRENTNAITSTDLKISNIQCDGGICILVRIPLSYKVCNLTYNSFINKTFDNSCHATDYIAFYQNSSRVLALSYCKDDCSNWGLTNDGQLPPLCASDFLWDGMLMVVLIMFGIALGIVARSVIDLSIQQVIKPVNSTTNLPEKSYLNPASHISYGLSDFVD